MNIATSTLPTDSQQPAAAPSGMADEASASFYECLPSFAQERFWFLNELQPASGLYNTGFATRLHGPLDQAALQHALQQVMQRHDALRTCFRLAGEHPAQPTAIVHLELPLPLEVSDLQALPEAGREPRLNAMVAELFSRPFDLARAPLLRAHLLLLGPQEQVLVLAMHHIIFDGWSFSILLGELQAAYNAQVQGQPLLLPEPEIQYPDYADWHRNCLEQGEFAPQLAYWQEYLRGAPQVLELPLCKPRPAQPSFLGATSQFEITPATQAALQAFNAASGATDFMTLLSAFSVLLYHYARQQDFCLAYPIANRNRPETARLIGLFLNTLVYRARIDPAASFADLVQTTRAESLAAYDNQDMPFEKVVDALCRSRDLNRTPLVQVMFVLQNTPGSELALKDLRSSPQQIDTASAKFDLTLTIRERAGQLTGSFEYASDLFEASFIAAMGQHFCTLLAQLLAAPQQAMGQHGMIDGASYVASLPARPAPYSLPTPSAVQASLPCLHQMFEAQVALDPQRIALVHEGTTLSYAELNARANQLARHLRQHGIGPDTLVPICVNRSPEMLIGMFAILKAGAAYLPLDPAYPRERLEFMLADARATILLTEAALLPELPACDGLTLFCLDRDQAQLAHYASTDLPCEISSANLAYCIFTSGSTGRPKGTLITHANVSRLFAVSQRLYGFNANDVWTLFHSFAFDFSVWEIFGALCYGGKLVIVPYLVSRSSDDFYDLLCREGVTVLNQTPSAFKQLTSVVFRDAELKPGLALRVVIFGGEALNPAALRPWFALPAAQQPALVNMYGITETTVHVTHKVIDAVALDGSGSPIGVALDDLEIYILDAHLNPLPHGVFGEMFVGGAGLARGYLHRPDLSAERFVPNPFSPLPGQRMYKTGDLARYLANGEIEFLGRIDRQIKLRGFRIELGEIEACLTRMPTLEEAVVSIVGADEGDARLVAWVVFAPGASIDSGEIKFHLKQHLPAFMIPAEIMPLAAFPLTSNGKIDMARLPAPSLAVRDASNRYVAPVGEQEEALAAIWEQVLKLDMVGTEDNFFAIGGDSIRAVQVVRLANARGMATHISQLFQHQNVAGMARAIAAQTRSEQAAIATPPWKLPGAALRLAPEFADLAPFAYPLSGMQKVMIREYRKHQASGLGIYHVQQSLRLRRAAASHGAMLAALTALVAAHPAFRTVFVNDAAGVLVQAIRPQAPFELVRHDLTGLSPQAQEAAILDLLQRDRAQPFAVNDPAANLFRFHWLQIGADEFELMMSLHHAIDDGWGNQVFLNQLYELYPQCALGQPASLPLQANVHEEFVALEQQVVAAGPSLAFWQNAILPVTGRHCLPRAAAQGQTAEAQNTGGLIFTLPRELVQAIMALSKTLHVTPKAVLLAAYIELIEATTGIRAPTVAIIANGRSDLLSDPLHALGLFWNMLPFHVPPTAVAESGSATALRIRQVQQQLLAIEPHTHYPLLQIERQHNADELFFAGFNFVSFHNAAGMRADSGLSLHNIRSHDKFHLPLNLFASLDRPNQSVYCRIHYDNQYFSDAAIRTFSSQFADVLSRITAANPT